MLVFGGHTGHRTRDTAGAITAVRRRGGAHALSLSHGVSLVFPSPIRIGDDGEVPVEYVGLNLAPALVLSLCVCAHAGGGRAGRHIEQLSSFSIPR